MNIVQILGLALLSLSVTAILTDVFVRYWYR